MGQYARIRESSLMVTDKDKLLSFLRGKTKGNEFYLRLPSENKWENEDDELFWRLKFEFPVKDFLSIDDDGMLDFCSIGEYDEDSWKVFAPYLKGYIEWDGEGVELWRDVFDGNGNIKQYYPRIIWSKEAVCNGALPLTDQEEKNITGQKIVIPIAGMKGGLCLTIEASTDLNYPCEIYAGITTPEGVWLQNVAYICQEYAYREEDIEYKNSFSVKAFSRPFLEDPDRNLSGLEITDNLSLKDFLESDEWKNSQGGGYYPEKIDKDFFLKMVCVRFPECEGNAPILEKAVDRLFTGEYGRSFTEYLLPDKILGDSVINYCIEHAVESLQDLL